MHVSTQRYCIYQRNLYFRELTDGRTGSPEHPKENVDVARTSQRNIEMIDMHKVHNGIVFIKGIYTSGNSRMAELVRPNIQKKIADICIHEMILCM